MQTTFEHSLHSYTIANDTMSVTILNEGATITSVKVYLSSLNTWRELTLGTTEERYRTQRAYLGRTVGRVANRIANGRFQIADKTYYIPTFSNTPHSLHGGKTGFDKKIFVVSKHTPTSLTMHVTSPDGEEGFPGNVALTVHYRLQKNTLTIEYQANTDHITPLNITNHTYWNLDGTADTPQQCSILQHKLACKADCYLPIDKESIPTGVIATVANTAFDLQHMQVIEDIVHKQDYLATHGLDHAWVFSSPAMQDHLVTLVSSDEQVTMQVTSSYPAVQLYTANFFQGTPSRSEAIYQDFAGIAIEPEYYPNFMNNAQFLTNCPLCASNTTFWQCLNFTFSTK